MIVKLRKKKLKNGKTSLYLAFWNTDAVYQIKQGKNKGNWKTGRWEYKYLKLYLGKDRELNRETMRLAESIKAKRQLELQNYKHGLGPKFKKKGDFIEYFAAIQEKKYPGTKTPWSSALKHLRDYTGGDLTFESISKEWLEQFKEYLLKKLSRNSASVYFVKIKAALKMAVKDEIIDKDPGNDVKKIRMVETKKIYLTYDEVSKLAKTPCQNELMKRAFLFGCYTGLRVSDLERLEWRDIRQDEGGFKIEFRQKKTKGFEYLPLNKTALSLLNMSGDKVLDGKIFKIPDRKWAGKLFDRWTKAAGINKRVRFHTARHTFATLSLTYGVDLYTVSKLLGHRDISTTQVYAKVVDEKKREAINMLPEV